MLVPLILAHMRGVPVVRKSLEKRSRRPPEVVVMMHPGILHMLQNELRVTREFGSVKDRGVRRRLKVLQMAMTEFIRDSETMKTIFEEQCKRLYETDIEEDQELGMLLRRLLEG